MKRTLILMLVIIVGLIVTDVTSSGKDSIQSNDGTMKLGVTDRAMRITQPGVSVLDTTDQDTIINENNNSFKIIGDPIIIRATCANSAFGSASIPHGQATTPAYQAFIDVDPDLTPFSAAGVTNLPNPALAWGLIGSSVEIFMVAAITVDATNIKFSINLSGVYPSGTYDFSAKVYILQETAI